MTRTARPVGTDHRETALRWLTGYLAQPHPAVGRDGAVCPFVEPALQAGSVEIRVRDLPAADSAPTEADLVEVIDRAVADFRELDFTGRNPTLHALVVVLPGIPEDRLELLDRAHAARKTALAADGLMLGQFHPRCPEPAARNPAFLVGRSPVPMIALRHMAFHDVLFLHERPDWFEAYARRFGSRYRVGLAADPMFVSLFYRAARAHGLPLPLERWREAAPAVRPVPAAYARPAVDRLEACRILGYELRAIDWSREVDWLCQLLPSTSTEDGERYEYHDVANLALAARTGRSMPEQAESMVLRFARNDPATWSGPRRWRLQLRWTCSAPDCPGGRWELPAPELAAPDRLVSWEVAGGTVTGEVELHGRVGQLAGAAGTLYDGTLARLQGGDLAYQWMPEPMRWTLEAALANRTMDCVSTSLLLEREAAAAGLRTRVRRGLLLGPVTIEHVWPEVEQDGRWLPLDPVLAFLDRRVNGRRPGAGLAAFCRGSLVNRLLPLPYERGEPLARHDCPAGGTPTLAVLAHAPRAAPTPTPTPAPTPTPTPTPASPPTPTQEKR
jgi:heptaprenyl diphosphate synthase